MRRVVLLLLLACCCICAAHAQTGKRVALVIGNDIYPKTEGSFGPLKNARNDARAVAEKLRELGFELVGGKAQLDVDSVRGRNLIAQFTGGLGKDDVAFFYYAGHGLGGILPSGLHTNYLIPIDSQKINYVEDLYVWAMDVRTLTSALEQRGSGTNIIMLDACRSRGLPSKGRSSLQTGAFRMSNIPQGTFIGYSASDGQEALDMPESNHGAFTGVLLPLLSQPGLTIDSVFNRLTADVRRIAESKGKRQIPIRDSSLEGDFYLVQGNTVNIVTAPATVAVAAPAPIPVDPAAIDLAMWQGALAAGTEEAYQDYLRSNPKGKFRVLAEQNIGNLNKGHAEAAKPKQDVVQMGALGGSAQKLTRILSCGREFVLTNSEEIKFEFNSGELDPLSHQNLDFVAACLKRGSGG